MEYAHKCVCEHEDADEEKCNAALEYFEECFADIEFDPTQFCEMDDESGEGKPEKEDGELMMI